MGGESKKGKCKGPEKGGVTWEEIGGQEKGI